ncbi:MAG: hypothetical protein ACLVGL_12680 [Waltera sp.]
MEYPVQCGCNVHVASGFFCVKIIFDNVDFQLFLTQILYLNSKRVKIGGEHMEYLNKVLGIEVAYEDLQERCSAEKRTREEILPSAPDASTAFHLWRRTGTIYKSSREELGTDTYFYIKGIETA